MDTHTHTHTHTHTCKCVVFFIPDPNVNVCGHTRTHRNAHKSKHTHILSLSHTHAITHEHVQTHTQSPIHTHIKHTHTQTHTRNHSYTHKNRHRHTHTHRHTLNHSSIHKQTCYIHSPGAVCPTCRQCEGSRLLLCKKENAVAERGPDALSTQFTSYLLQPPGGLHRHHRCLMRPSPKSSCQQAKEGFPLSEDFEIKRYALLDLMEFNIHLLSRSLALAFALRLCLFPSCSLRPPLPLACSLSLFMATALVEVV